MPLIIIYLLIILATGTVLGIGFMLGENILLIFTFIALIIISYVLWDPFLKPIIDRIKNK